MSTLTPSFGRPQAGEYNPYYGRYISLVSSDDVIEMLEKQPPETVSLFKSASAKADFRYAPGKWSVKEMLGHVNDTERVMAYRALRVARRDKTPLPGFEQDDFVRDGNFGRRTLPDLIDEFTDVRKATLSLFRTFDGGVGERIGEASGHAVSVRALAYIIAGHELHHRKLLQEKYLG
jgi:hypothetical protein